MFVPRSKLLNYILLIVGCIALPTSGARAQIDDNSNGMDDIWETANGVNAAADDPDGDGKTNLQESIAGTDPKNPKSVFNPKSFELVDGNTARITWPTVPGKKYQIQVSTGMGKWQDVSEAVMGDGNDKMVDLPFAATFLAGKMLDSRWPLAVGEGVVKVKSNAASNVIPNALTSLDSLNIPQTVPNVDNFGHWVRGWLIPPTTGSYQFWIASDDSSELWLSTDATPAKKVKIAYTNYTSYQQWDKYPTQASAAINLTANVPYYFEAFQCETTGSDHLSVAWSGPSIPARTILGGKYVTSVPQSLNDLQVAAPSLFFRVSVADVDTDGDGISDADELMLGYNPNSSTTVSRVSDFTTLHQALTAANIVTVGSPQTRAYESSLTPGRFTFFRSGSFGPLTIPYTISGTADSGNDYVSLSGSVYLPVGKNSVSVDVAPIQDNVTEPAETVTVKVAPGANYTVGTPFGATVTIDDAPDVLYVANLRPDPSVTSGGYGTVSLNVAGNQVFGTIAVNFGNLGTSQLRTELYIANGGTTGSAILILPAGQISDNRWDFAPTSDYNTQEILAALAAGQVYARVISDAFPDGEIYGQLLATQGWQTMPTPPPPPTLSSDPPTAMEAARFLTQATYGPTRSSINELVGMGSYDAWLNQQFALPPSLTLPYVHARRLEYLARTANLVTPNDGYWRSLQEAWWENAIRAPDQLRQRMTFALSEIMVVSGVGVLFDAREGVSNYYDLLLTHAFGNFRTLLKDVTLSPMMGNYLSMIRNQKPNPLTGAEPDENYAREIMQLFTVGLNQLNQDGSLKLSSKGFPIPTYTQQDIVGLAHVFTGWSYPTPSGQSINYLYGNHDYINPMVAYEAYHDTAEKHIINNSVIPAGQTTAQDIDQAIDVIFNHPNVGPFIARQLIQKFVTSNPSPGYIYRVASAFNDNGSGVRGDLQATLRAVLTDYEARTTTTLGSQSFGKQREPLIRFSHLLRALNLQPPLPTDNRFFIDSEYTLKSQVVMNSPSVFNFFSPNYMPPGPVAAAGIFAPEFQITSETTTIDQLNYQYYTLFSGISTPEPLAPNTYSKAYLDFTPLLAILNQTNFSAAQNQQALLDELNLVLLNGRMSRRLRGEITAAFARLPSWYNTTNLDYQKNRIRMAAYLIFASPEYVIQK